MTQSGARPLAMVTGTSSGIGEAFARRLAHDGVDVILIARRKDRLEALADELRGTSPVTVEVLAADLTDAGDLARVEQRIEQAPALSLLVNNAARGDIAPFTSMPRETIANMIALNVTALTRLTHAAVPGMIARGGGTIINVSSGAAYGLIPPFSVYGATKAFVSHFTELLHEEVGGKGIRLQSLVPGLTRTNLGNAQETGLFDQFPKEVVMTPESIVDASLASLSMGELHCFTLLNDPEQWVQASRAIYGIGAIPLSSEIAPRFRNVSGLNWRSMLQG